MSLDPSRAQLVALMHAAACALDEGTEAELRADARVREAGRCAWEAAANLKARAEALRDLAVDAIYGADEEAAARIAEAFDAADDTVVHCAQALLDLRELGRQWSRRHQPLARSSAAA